MNLNFSPHLKRKCVTFLIGLDVLANIFSWIIFHFFFFGSFPLLELLVWVAVFGSECWLRVRVSSKFFSFYPQDVDNGR